MFVVRSCRVVRPVEDEMRPVEEVGWGDSTVVNPDDRTPRHVCRAGTKPESHQTPGEIHLYACITITAMRLAVTRMERKENQRRLPRKNVYLRWRMNTSITTKVKQRVGVRR
jgi:hypothetical protein